MTAPHFMNRSATLYHGDSLEVLRALPDNSIDSCVTDPPYGLASLPASKVTAALTAWMTGDRAFIPAGSGFMGSAWDRFVPPPALWDEVLRVLKPGGYLVSFAGARTQDLMGMSIRLAGFQMKDQIHWLRSDSFNKSKHVLKAGYEPILLAQKPLEGTIPQNVAKYGTGSINADDCRTPFRNAADEAETKTKNRHGVFDSAPGGNAVYGDFTAVASHDYDAPGRWPSNLLLDDDSAAHLDELNPSTKSRKGKPNRGSKPGAGWGMDTGGTEYDDEGGPSRFYTVIPEEPEPFFYAGRATSKERPVVDGVAHTTVKPLKLMDWLVRLVTPEGGTTLDPFAGSGTTGEAAQNARRTSVLIEANGPYLPLIVARLGRSDTSV